MNIEICDINAQAINDWFNILIFADSGVGKTLLASTLVQHESMQGKKALYLNFEGGLKTVSHLPYVSKVDISSTAQLEQIFWDIKNNKEKYEQFPVIILDSITEMQTMNIDDVVQTAISKNPNKNKGRSIDDVYVEDYGKTTKQLKRIFRNFRDLEKHVIFVALTRNYKTEGGHLTKVEPNLTEKLATSVRGYVDFVWYEYLYFDNEANEMKRGLITENNGIIPAKTRGVNFNKWLRDIFNHSVPQDYVNLAFLYEQYLIHQNLKK